MIRTRLLVVAACGAIALALSSCTAPSAQPGSDPSILRPGGPDGSTATAIPTSEPVSEADVTFVQSMIAHHAQAVTLAELADGRAADTELAGFAQRIAQGQQAELDMMVQWLRQRGLEVDGQGHDPAMMPGGISATTMARAEAASGAEFDALFLDAMIAHHRGALVMAQQRLDATGSSTITRLAQSVIAGQQLEIDRLEQIGARLGLAG